MRSSSNITDDEEGGDHLLLGKILLGVVHGWQLISNFYNCIVSLLLLMHHLPIDAIYVEQLDRIMHVQIFSSFLVVIKKKPLMVTT